MKILYKQDNFPVLQNQMYHSCREALECATGDILLIEDENSGLIYNAKFQPEKMVFDQNYQNEQGVSQRFQQHMADAADIVESRLGRQDLVEIGCGKGLFLEMLLERGCDITGFDKTYEGANPRVQRKHYGPSLIDQAKGIIIRHVLDYVQDPYEFLQSIHDANRGEGRIYIETPNFDWIAERRAWFNIYYETLSYFRLGDFKRMFGELVDCGYFFGGQYLYVVAELSSLRPPERDPNDPVTLPVDFARGINVPIAHGRRSAIWGGASKGVVFALLKSRAGYAIDTVIDINPAKQGKYLAGTGIRVQSPEEALATLPPGSTIFVMNSNYLDEIKRMSDNAYKYIEIDNEQF